MDLYLKEEFGFSICIGYFTVFHWIVDDCLIHISQWFVNDVDVAFEATQMGES